jgi:hypothetical protein
MKTYVTRHAVSSVYADSVNLWNADEVIIIYPYGDIYEIFAVRKGEQYEIEFDRDIFLVSLEDAKVMSEIWYDHEDIVAIRKYFNTKVKPTKNDIQH